MFAYNLINEPLATATQRKPGEWVHSDNTLDGESLKLFQSLNPNR